MLRAQVQATESGERDAARTPAWLTRNAQLTDANAALFDAAHAFHGCIPGIHEVLRRQGLMAGGRGASTRTNASRRDRPKRSPASAVPTRT